MTLLTPPPLTTPPLAAALRSSSALVVADERCCGRALEVLCGALDIANASVTIAMMPVALPAVATFASLTGLTTRDRMMHDMVERADRAARAAALGLAAAGVTYRTVRSWSQVTELMDDGRHDVVVLGCVPRRRSLRRLVELSARTGAQQLLHVA